MTPRLAIALAMALLMLASSLAAIQLRPNRKAADAGARIDIETLIPKAFGEWTMDEAPALLVGDPETQANLARIYTQILARTYTGPRGARVMLSIAYGTDQSDGMNVHRPEVCYPAQGFRSEFSRPGALDTPWGTIPLREAHMRRGSRSEPLTYWITVGTRAVKGGVEFKLQQLSYGLTGRIPDGMLVRVSTLDEDANRAFELQRAFLKDMLDALSPAARMKIAGLSAPLAEKSP